MGHHGLFSRGEMHDSSRLERRRLANQEDKKRGDTNRKSQRKMKTRLGMKQEDSTSR